MNTRTVQSGAARVEVEALGDPSKPCVILVMGAQASMLWWPQQFCELLASRGRYVLRFDLRDTGLSTKYPVGAPGYSMEDLADDVIAILDDFEIARAELLGVSMGGIIGQIVGLKYPERLSRLVLLSSTPLGAEHMNLPGPAKAFSEGSKKTGMTDWNDRDQAIDQLVRYGRILAGKAELFDEAAARVLIGADFDRSGGLAHGTNHFILKSAEHWAPRLPELKPPLRVLHGCLDPIFPIEHGRALARLVPGATLRELPGGHGLDAAAWEPVISVLVN